MSVTVVDAGVVVSAALNPDGTARRALAAARARTTIALSAAVLREVTAVLARPKFARILTVERRHEAIELQAAPPFGPGARDGGQGEPPTAAEGLANA